MDNKQTITGRYLIWLVVASKMTKLLKLAKLFKLATPMITVVSMSISAIAYVFWIGPWFAVGLIVMIFIHEMGHVFAMQMRGYKVSAPVFIPFLGAVIFSPKMTNRDDEAFIGIGGPILGGLAAAIVLGIWYFVDDKQSDLAVILLMVSYIGMFINVFNMLPIRPLDGGRVTQAIGSWFKYIGVIILAVASVIIKEPLILFIWIIIMPELTIMPIKLRASIASLMWIAMTYLMISGYSTQAFWADIFDIGFGLMLTVMLVSMALMNKDIADEDNQRPELPNRERIIWFFRYGILAVFLIGLMAYQVEHLPTPSGQTQFTYNELL